MRTFEQDLLDARAALPCQPWSDEHWRRIRAVSGPYRGADLSSANLRGADLRVR